MAYFDHDADVGVIGRGASVEEAFANAARATFALTTDLQGVEARERIAIEFEEADPEIALVRWLNLLLAGAHERGLALRSFSVKRAGDRWLGEAWGEPWRERHERGTDVKGATLTMLSVKRAGADWEARCVVDV